MLSLLFLILFDKGVVGFLQFINKELYFFIRRRYGHIDNIGYKACSVFRIEWHIVGYESIFRIKIVFSPSFSAEICLVIIIVIRGRTIKLFAADFTFIYQFL